MDGSEADLGVIDLTLPDGEGTELIEELREANPDFAALVLTASLERTEHARAVEAGAAGVLHKSADVDTILDATRRIGEGETLLSEDELISLLRLAGQNREEAVEARASIEQITPREREVLQMLAEGLSNKEIAARLHMSVDTERTHMMNILEQAGRALQAPGPRLRRPARAGRYPVSSIRELPEYRALQCQHAQASAFVRLVSTAPLAPCGLRSTAFRLFDSCG